MDHILLSHIDSGTSATAHIDSDGDVDLTVRSEYGSASLYARPEDFAAFARSVLADAGVELEAPKESTPGRPKVGDRVRIISGEHSWHANRVGVLEEIDTDDPTLPYRVTDEDGVFIAWARSVEVIGDAPEALDTNSTRLTRAVEEAKRLLADTSHTGADVITLAERLTAE